MLLSYVTDRHLLPDASLDELLRRVEFAGAAGIDWIQIREKDLSGRELADFTRRALAVPERTRVIVNERIDVALAVGAAGVHLSGASVLPAEAIAWLRAGNAPRDFLVGVSCHTLDEGIAAEKAGANYIVFGPIYETPSKAAFGAAQGLEKLSDVCDSVRIPVLAIGGVTQANAAECLRAGASGIAAIRLFQEARDSNVLAQTVSHLRSLAR